MADKIKVHSPENQRQSSATEISLSENGVSDSKSEDASRNAVPNPYNVCELNMTPDMLNRSFNITLKFISPAASSGPFCRICHEGDALEDLVSLCKCTGSVGLVHLTCIERWLSTRRVGEGDDKCEICNYTFEIIRSPRSITEWYQSDQGTMSNRRNVLGDAACFSMITPLTALSSFLCFEGAKQHVIWNNSLEAGCLMALATFLITVYIVWNVLTVRYHLRSFFRWRSLNQNVRLVRYRRKSSSRDPASNQRNILRSIENRESSNSLSDLVTNNLQTPPFSHQSPLESVDVVTQTSNLSFTTT